MANVLKEQLVIFTHMLGVFCLSSKVISILDLRAGFWL